MAALNERNDRFLRMVRQNGRGKSGGGGGFVTVTQAVRNCQENAFAERFNKGANRHRRSDRASARMATPHSINWMNLTAWWSYHRSHFFMVTVVPLPTLDTMFEFVHQPFGARPNRLRVLCVSSNRTAWLAPRQEYPAPGRGR